MAVSHEMQRVLKLLRKGPACAADLRCDIRTLMALERRGLIQVETTLSSITNPRSARAWIKDKARATLSPSNGESDG